MFVTWGVCLCVVSCSLFDLYLFKVQVGGVGEIVLDMLCKNIIGVCGNCFFGRLGDVPFGDYF